MYNSRVQQTCHVLQHLWHSVVKDRAKSTVKCANQKETLIPYAKGVELRPDIFSTSTPKEVNSFLSSYL